MTIDDRGRQRQGAVTTSAIQRLKARWWVPAILLCAVLLIALVAKHAYHDYHPTAAEAAKSHVLFVALHETGNKVRLDLIEPWEWDEVCILQPYDTLTGTPFAGERALPYNSWLATDGYWGLVFSNAEKRVELIRIRRGEIDIPKPSARCVSRQQEPYLESTGSTHGVFENRPWTTLQVRLEIKK